MRVGAIVFDPPMAMGGSDRTVVALNGGWASIGGTPARRIQGVTGLPSDVVWLTNLDYVAFNNLKLNMHSNFRSAGWLRTAFNQIAMEFGVGDATGKAKEAAETISLVAHRVAAHSSVELDVSIEKTHTRLNENFAERMGLDRSKLPDAHHRVFETISQHPQVTVVQSVGYGRGRVNSMTVRRNRLTHARYLLSQQVPPDTGWRLVDTPLSDAELERMTQPFVVRCRLTDFKPLVAETLSWGSGAKNVREWLTDVEWRVVRQHAKVEVRSALICDEQWVDLEPYRKMLPDDNLSELSYSLGLVAEQIWTALTNQRPRFGGVRGTTARAAWLRSLDRMSLFDFALRLGSHTSVNVLSYGVGAAVLSVPEKGMPLLVKAALEEGLMPPMGGFQEARAGA